MEAFRRICELSSAWGENRWRFRDAPGNACGCGVQRTRLKTRVFANAFSGAAAKEMMGCIWRGVFPATPLRPYM